MTIVLLFFNVNCKLVKQFLETRKTDESSQYRFSCEEIALQQAMKVKPLHKCVSGIVRSSCPTLSYN